MQEKQQLCTTLLSANINEMIVFINKNDMVSYYPNIQNMITVATNGFMKILISCT